jgi:hypothetical protein
LQDPRKSSKPNEAPHQASHVRDGQVRAKAPAPPPSYAGPLPSSRCVAIVRAAVLADALEEAGCDDADLLGHLRGPGPHAHGCWALDLLLGEG